MGLDFLKNLGNRMPQLESEIRNGAFHTAQQLEAVKVLMAHQANIFTFVYGETRADPSLAILPRRWTQPALTLEPSDLETAPPKVERVELKVRTLAGYTPSKATYTNLGDKPFKVIEVAVGGATGTAFTVLPGRSIESRLYLETVFVVPVGGQPAFYQVRCE